MITHIVMCKFADEHRDEIEGIVERLNELPQKIDVIRGYEVGIDEIQSPRSWDAVLYATFDSYDDLQTYNDHPDHQAVVKDIVAYTTDVASVDYES